jgi:hypothetical protein
METFVISPDGRVLRWTCMSCQHDNIFVTNFPLYPEKVKWRCAGCCITVTVYRPDGWIEAAMSGYMSQHRDGRRAKWEKQVLTENDQPLGSTST